MRLVKASRPSYPKRQAFSDTLYELINPYPQKI